MLYLRKSYALVLSEPVAASTYLFLLFFLSTFFSHHSAATDTETETTSPLPDGKGQVSHSFLSTDLPASFVPVNPLATMAPSKPYVPTGRSPGRPRKAGRGLSQVVASAVAKTVKATTSTALRSGRVYTPKVSAKKVGGTDNSATASNGTPVKRGRGRPKKVINVEVVVDGDMSEEATNGTTEEAEDGENEIEKEEVDNAPPVPVVKRGRGRPKKIVTEVLSGDGDETADANANADGAEESIEVEDEVAEEAAHGGSFTPVNGEAHGVPSTAGVKRGRGRPKKESNIVDELAPLSPAPVLATISTVKRGKGRPPKKKRLSYFGRPVPALPTEESVHEGKQELDGADEDTALFVETSLEHLKTTAEHDTNNSSSSSSDDGLPKVGKLLPSLMAHSAGKSPSPFHGEERELSPANLDGIGRPRRHGIFKGKTDEDDSYQLAPDDDEEEAPSGPVAISGRDGVQSDGLEGVRASVEGI